MTSSKPTANLTAIYNLNFYRKQKLWKLNAPIRKEKNQKEKLRKKLNETYLITDQVQDESHHTHPLNLAFFEPEEEHEVCDPKQTLSQQWQEPVNIWPKTVAKSEQNISCVRSVEADKSVGQQSHRKKDCIHKRLEVLLKAAKQEEDAESVLALQNIAQDNISESHDFNLEEEHMEENNFWTPAELYQTVWSEPWMNPVDDVWLDHDVIDGLKNYQVRSHNQTRADGDWDTLLNQHTFHPPSTSSLNQTVDSDSALDSSNEFMRGAHSAPHSSEIDIALPPEFMFGTLSSRVLRDRNSRQLVQARSEHSSTVVKLIAEKWKRTKSSFASEMGSYEEIPTRDVGLYPDGDEFVAGSHLAPFNRLNKRSEFFGRGRGRLLQNRQKIS